MAQNWNIKAHDPALIASITKNTGVSPIVAQLLAARDITDPNEIKQFIEAPFQLLRPGDQLPGCVPAADAIIEAIRNGQRIVIYGDYDADGMTATAILYRCLKLLGGDVGYFVPNRLDDGYGLNEAALTRIAGEGAKLLVTVDCGIASVHEAEVAKQLGLKLIVTDHHQCGTTLPAAVAIVHPGLPGGDYPFAGLCGAGVALKLAWRICQKFSNTDKVVDSHRAFLLQALGLAAIGTVTDVVPLVDENRLIVRHGLQFMKQAPVTGLEQLLKLTGLDQKPNLSSEDIGFTIGPRLNAAGRLGQAQLGVELLVTDSRQRGEALAEYIHQLNISRDSLERKISLSANKMIRANNLDQQPAIVLASRDWHVGVIGIVAGRIAERYNRPTILISQDEIGQKPGVGSCRTACGVDLYEALQDCHELLVSWGGHRAAAGLKIVDENIDGFRDALVEYVTRHTTPEDLLSQLDIDLEVTLNHLTLDTLGQLENLAPFGMANRRPVFCICNARLAGPPKRMGNSERHLSLQIVQHDVRLRCVAFGKGDWADELSLEGGPYDFAFMPVVNEFRGRRSVELQLLDWRLHAEGTNDPLEVRQSVPLAN